MDLHSPDLPSSGGPQLQVWDVFVSVFQFSARNDAHVLIHELFRHVHRDAGRLLAPGKVVVCLQSHARNPVFCCGGAGFPLSSLSPSKDVRYVQ